MAVHLALSLFPLFALRAGAIELTTETWDSATAGKTVFVKFLSPWCGHCKRMKPDWDRLMDGFKDSKSALVADVDCTTNEGKPLCIKNDVRGYPAIKYGDPNDLKDYNGARNYDDLKKFADENLGPSCGPDHLDLCDETNKANIEKFQQLTPEELGAKIKEVDDKVKKITDKANKAVGKLKDEVAELKKSKENASKKKDDDVANAKKKIGLGMMKAVTAAKKKQDEAPAKKGKKSRKKKQEL